MNEAEFQREHDIAAAWAKAEDRVKQLELQNSELKRLASEDQAEIRRIERKADGLKKELDYAMAAGDIQNKELEETKRLNEDLQKIVEWFALALNNNTDKLSRVWSFGYWEGVDPGLALVNGGSDKGIENSRFHAVLQITSGEVGRILYTARKRKCECLVVGTHRVDCPEYKLVRECHYGWKPKSPGHDEWCPVCKEKL